MQTDILVEIVKGKLPRSKGRWYTRFIPLSSRPNLDEQLAAIRQLGESGDPPARVYLESLLQTETSNSVVGNYHKDVEADTTFYTHPQAGGALACALDYHTVRTGAIDLPYSENTYEHRRRQEVLNAINDAIHRIQNRTKTDSTAEPSH